MSCPGALPQAVLCRAFSPQESEHATGGEEKMTNDDVGNDDVGNGEFRMANDELPIGWAISEIGRVCLLKNGRAFKPAEWSSTGIPIVRIQNLNNPDGKYNYFKGSFESRYHLKGGELLFAWSGTPGTTFGAHIWQGSEAVLNQHIFRVDFDDQSFDKRFFRHAINQKLDELIGVAHGGVGLRHVTKGTFEKTEIKVPPLAEQKRIADKLDAVLGRVDACRARLDHVPALLKRFRQSVLAAATSGRLTEEWRMMNGVSDDWQDVILGKIADVQGGVTKDTKKQSSEDEEVPYLRVANVQRGYIDLTETKLIRIPSNRLPSLLLKVGDVLFNEGGDLDKLGRGWIWEGQIPKCSYQNHVFRARLYNSDDQPKYISWWGNYCGLDYFLRSGKQTTNLASINKSMLCNLPISLPSPPEQQEIVRRFEELFAFADRIEARLATAQKTVERLTPATLAKAFRGELVPQDPSDEPASMLLRSLEQDAPKVRRKGRP